MTVFELLRRCKLGAAEIHGNEYAIQTLRDLSTNVVAPTDSANSGGGSGTPADRVGRITSAIVSMQAEIDRRRERLEFEITTAMQLLAREPVGLREKVLIRFYINGDTVKDIALDEKYSCNYIRDLKISGERYWSTRRVVTPGWYDASCEASAMWNDPASVAANG